mmetsp:Transcript_41524/g.120238  ORF Transcript_41524/g.120238 Transcript_41524/m.120238 type:complete len:282 (-) Transcript_41524:751-1596(-)
MVLACPVVRSVGRHHLVHAADPVAHQDVHGAEHAGLEEEDVQGAAVEEEADGVALAYEVARVPRALAVLHAVHGALDRRADAVHVRQAHGDLRHVPEGGVVDVDPAVEAAEGVEHRVAAPGVPKAEPGGAVRDAEEVPRNIPSLHQVARHGRVEVVVGVGHQDVRNRGATDEHLGQWRAVEHLPDVELVALYRQFRLQCQLVDDEVDLHVSGSSDDHVGSLLAYRPALRLVFERPREELVERSVPVALPVVGVVVLRGRHARVDIISLAIDELHPVAHMLQ